MSVYPPPLQYRSCLFCEQSFSKAWRNTHVPQFIGETLLRDLLQTRKHKKTLLLFPRPPARQMCNSDCECCLRRDQQRRGWAVWGPGVLLPTTAVTPCTAVRYLSPVMDCNQGKCPKKFLVHQEIFCCPVLAWIWPPDTQIHRRITRKVPT